MTEKKKLLLVNYLTFEEIHLIYESFYQGSAEMGEPVPDWSFVNKSNIHNLVTIPQSYYYGEEVYKTLEQKAAIIFYTINKGHLFPNGNKRMSVLCLLMFLLINNKEFAISPEQLRDKVLWLAQTKARDFEVVKNDLVQWIQDSFKK